MTLPNPVTDRLLLNPTEVATLIGFGRNKTYKLIRAGDIPSVRIGGRVRVPRQALDQWVKSLAEQSRRTGRRREQRP